MRWVSTSGAPITALVICIAAALWGWYFFIDGLCGISAEERRRNPKGVLFRISVLLAIAGSAHLPLAICIYVFIVSGYWTFG